MLSLAEKPLRAREHIFAVLCSFSRASRNENREGNVLKLGSLRSRASRRSPQQRVARRTKSLKLTTNHASSAASALAKRIADGEKEADLVFENLNSPRRTTAIIAQSPPCRNREENDEGGRTFFTNYILTVKEGVASYGDEKTTDVAFSEGERTVIFAI